MIIIDNVNNRSGAPQVAKSISSLFDIPIYSIRSDPNEGYQNEASGILSKNKHCYVLGIIFLFFKINFLKKFLISRVVICNTCLTFPFIIVSKIFRKKVIGFLHENTKKNLLYKMGIYFLKNYSDVIVTPSKLAFASLGLPDHKWVIIPNLVSESYYKHELKNNFNESVRILFCGGVRGYKGVELFEKIKKLAIEKGKKYTFTNLGEGSEKIIQLTPEIYENYDINLILTNNKIWKETFGLVGVEGALCGCIPMYTDEFSYKEIWQNFDNLLFIGNKDADQILCAIDLLVEEIKVDGKLKVKIRNNALCISDKNYITESWEKLLHQIKL